MCSIGRRGSTGVTRWGHWTSVPFFHQHQPHTFQSFPTHLHTGAQSQARNTYVSNDVVPKVVLIAANPEKPVAACMTCGQAQLQLRVNTNAMTLGDLLSTVGWGVL